MIPFNKGIKRGITRLYNYLKLCEKKFDKPNVIVKLVSSNTVHGYLWF